MVPDRDQILSQMRRGALEYCILARLRAGAAYGFEIARTMGKDGVLLQSEGTLYPLLSRLRKSGLVETSWRESESGPPRRYYHLTDDGEAAVAAFADVWTDFRSAVDAALRAAEPAA